MTPSLAAKAGVVPSSVALNHLYYGDNLDVLRRHIASESVDLVYLDPPFNSNRSYNVLFKGKTGEDSPAQIEAFGDTWIWSHETEALYQGLVADSSVRIVDVLEAMRKLLGDNDVLAYLVMMAARMVELHRVLKHTGSIYLHCDPTASHYLKLLLDAIFGPKSFRNEIIWQRHNARSVRQSIWPRLHDVLLYYTNGERATFHETRVRSKTTDPPHDLVKGPEGKDYRTFDLTGAGLRNGETGRPWRGLDPSAKGRHWRTGHGALDVLDSQGLIHWTRSGWARERAAEPFVPAERDAITGDVWTDISSINAGAAERLGIPYTEALAPFRKSYFG